MGDLGEQFRTDRTIVYYLAEACASLLVGMPPTNVLVGPDLPFAGGGGECRFFKGGGV